MYKKLAAIVGVLLVLCSTTAWAQKEATAQMNIASKDIATAPGSVRQSQGISAGSGLILAEPIWKRLPDLRVTQVTPGTPSFEEDGSANVPLTVTIKNFGRSTATRFKISVDVQVDGEPRYVKPFTVPGQSDIWYPWQNGLASGEEVTFNGNLVISNPSGDSLIGKWVTISTMVDSISGDEFIPEWGRVTESNEENNELEVRIQLA
jgi:CARDB